MRIQLIFAIVLVLSLPLAAQNGSGKMQLAFAEFEGEFYQKGGQEFARFFKTSLSDQYALAEDALIRLYPEIKADKPRTIEGMDNLVYQPFQLMITIQHAQTKAEKTWSKKLTGRGNNPGEAVQKEIRSKVLGKSEVFEEFRTFLEAWLAENLGANCMEQVALARKLLEEGDHTGALTALNAVPAGSACEADKTAVASAAQEQLCKQVLHDAKMQAAQRRYRQAFDLLQKISFDAPCATEAAELATSIGENAGTDKELGSSIRVYVKNLSGSKD